MTSPGGRRRLALAIALTLITGPLAVSARAEDPTPACTEAPAAGGEWATYGQDLYGAQRQDAEHTIDVGNVDELQRLWTVGGTNYQSPPPIVAGGCVFINNRSVGRIQAYDIDTGGAPVWTSPEGYDTKASFAPTVVGTRVHYGIANGGRPRAVVADLTDPNATWASDVWTHSADAEQQSSAIVHEGIQVLFTTGPDFEPTAKQGYMLIDVETREVLAERLTTGDPNQAGGGVWGTPTVDPVTDHLYVGTSNPEQKQGETPYDNSIIKIDLDRTRPTFGNVVGVYEGTNDSDVYDNPVCQAVGDKAWVNGGVYGSSPTCGQLDVDFGVGPTLFRIGDTLYGAATQKSGFIHVFDAEDMTPVWSKQLWPSMSFLGGNLARIATDGTTLYVAANPGVLYAFEPLTGVEKWRTPLNGFPMKGGNVALANGVLFYVDDPGLKAFDARNGDLLWLSQITPGSSIGSGVAVAENTVVANHYGTIAAYRLPSTNTTTTTTGGSS